MKKGDTLIVQIEKLVFGGSGLARHDGQVIFVDYAAPGDCLEIEIIEAKKNFARGRLVNVIEPSSQRVVPPCGIFGRCGGCQWQHIGYESQLKAKQNILLEVLQRYLPDETVQLGSFSPSPNQYHYRNRIQVRRQGGELGFFGKASHQLVPLEKCLIAEEKLNRKLEELAKEKAADGKYRLQIGFDGQVTTTFLEEAEEPLGFAQVNQLQNINLQSEVLSTYERFVGSPIVDLYGGYGNLSLPIARRYPEVSIECVEWNCKAVSEGIERASAEKLKQIKFIQGDVAEYLQRVVLPKNALVVLDPPREGCHSVVVRELADKAPAVMIYISCDPMTWGRDVQLFLKEARSRGRNYRIATIHGLDMFPQTDHIEVFSVFERME